MPGDLILLTGASGFIGYRTLVTALASGHRVRCAVRSESSIAKIRSAPSIASLSPSDSQLSFVLVPDITVPHAYDEAVRGADYVIHCASPVPDFSGGPQQDRGSDEEVFVQPAIRGVVGMLESAAAAGSSSVRRVVITSSIVAIVPPAYFAGEGPDPDAVFTAESRYPDLTPPYPPGRAYAASKAASLNAADAWMAQHKPSFDTVNVMPLWVWGPDELSTTTARLRSTTNGFLLNLLTGGRNPRSINGGAVSVDDVARAQVLALRPEVKGNQSFILGRMVDGDGGLEGVAKEAARKEVPGAFERGVFRGDGEQATVRLPLEMGKTEAELGYRHLPFEEIVRGVAAQYWQLWQREN